MDRIACCVPYCRRTAKREATDGDHIEIICGKCWRAGVPKSRRTVYSRARREAFKAYDSNDARRYVIARRRVTRLWAVCKRMAIQSSMGIA